MDQNFQPFDLHRMFIGDLPLLFMLEIALRVFILTLYAILFSQLVSKRGSKQISALDFILIISLGSALGDPMFYPNVPITYGIIVITIVILLNQGFASLKAKFSYAREHFITHPTIVVSKGEIQTDSVVEEGFTEEQIFSMLRKDGIVNLNTVETAILEPGGTLSVFESRFPYENIDRDLIRDVKKINSSSSDSHKD